MADSASRRVLLVAGWLIPPDILLAGWLIPPDTLIGGWLADSAGYFLASWLADSAGYFDMWLAG